MRNVILIILFLLKAISIHCQYLAVYIPEDKLSEINIDGDTTDWNWVPQKYVISTDFMQDICFNSRKDEKNWNGKIIVGWNEVKNWIYILAIVRDDIRDMGRDPLDDIYWQDDCMELAVNPDNMGGKYDDKSSPGWYHTMKLYYSFPLADKTKELGLACGPSWFLKKFTYLDYAGKVYPDNRKQSGLVVYELGMSLWDTWNNDGPAFSKRHILSAGQVIKLFIGIDDMDTHQKAIDSNEDNRSGQWSTLAGPQWWYDAYQLSWFRLDYPINHDVSWNKIEQILKPCEQ